jgi:hypothetical protein
VAVTPPAEIDMANAEDVGAQLRSAFTIQRTLTPGGDSKRSCDSNRSASPA